MNYKDLDEFVAEYGFCKSDIEDEDKQREAQKVYNAFPKKEK